MRLQAIQEGIARFKKEISNHPDRPYLVHWESLKHFQENWDLDAKNFRQMYDASFQNTVSRQLWSAHSYEPKNAIITFIDFNEDYVRMAFRGLLDESLPLASRLDRFIYYCDELLKEYRKSFPKQFLNTHYHTYSEAFMYLAFCYPDKYALYNFGEFRAFLEKVGAKDVPLTHDLERFPKVLKLVYNLMQKDQPCMDLFLDSIDKSHYYKGTSLLLVSEFIASF